MSTCYKCCICKPGGACVQRWTATYTCGSGWGTPVAGEKRCETTAENVITSWTQSSSGSTYCDYFIDVPMGYCCTEDSTCTDLPDTTAPAVPASAPLDCCGDGYCFYHWTATYDCVESTWTVAPVGWTCLPAATPAGVWTQNGSSCLWDYYTKGDVCPAGGACPDVAAPTTPGPPGGGTDTSSCCRACDPCKKTCRWIQVTFNATACGTGSCVNSNGPGAGGIDYKWTDQSGLGEPICLNNDAGDCSYDGVGVIGATFTTYLSTDLSCTTVLGVYGPYDVHVAIVAGSYVVDISRGGGPGLFHGSVPVGDCKTTVTVTQDGTYAEGCGAPGVPGNYLSVGSTVTIAPCGCDGPP